MNEGKTVNYVVCCEDGKVMCFDNLSDAILQANESRENYKCRVSIVEERCERKTILELGRYETDN